MAIRAVHEQAAIEEDSQRLGAASRRVIVGLGDLCLVVEDSPFEMRAA
jgi:hypothetical protein